MKKGIVIFLMFISIRVYSHWSPSTYPQNFTYFEAISFMNQDTVWGKDANGFLISIDGGKVFNRVFDGFSFSNRIYNLGDTLIRVETYLWQSYDFGESWVRKVLRNNLGDTLLATQFLQQHISIMEKGLL
jgi:photosystem II stability/assembly factor-like uncharacterized protein